MIPSRKIGNLTTKAIAAKAAVHLPPHRDLGQGPYVATRAGVEPISRVCAHIFPRSKFS